MYRFITVSMLLQYIQVYTLQICMYINIVIIYRCFAVTSKCVIIFHTYTVVVLCG